MKRNAPGGALARAGNTSRCPHCGSREIIRDAARGDAVCEACGVVLEENTIVSEIAFAENSNGGSSVVGQFVSHTESRRIAGIESREATISSGKRQIGEMVAALGLTQHHAEAAQRLFTLAVQHNFLQGRRTPHVAAACLYIVCRRDKTPHMLLDFSEILQTNVFILGHCFLKLIRLLNLALPIVDPSLYIHRFSAKLEFGDKTHQVAMTALKLVASMKRDWLQLGRRPAGICAAALLIAARIHNFRRTQKEIIHTVRICDVTLRRRLLEFVETPTSEKTMEEFERLSYSDDPAEIKRDMMKGCNPPIFRHHQRKTMESLQERLLELHERHRDAERSGDDERISRYRSMMQALLEDEEFRKIDADLGVSHEPHTDNPAGRQAEFVPADHAEEIRNSIRAQQSATVCENGFAPRQCNLLVWYKKKSGVQTTDRPRMARRRCRKSETKLGDRIIRVVPESEIEASASASASSSSSSSTTLSDPSQAPVTQPRNPRDPVVEVESVEWWSSDEDLGMTESDLEREVEAYIVPEDQRELREKVWTEMYKDYLDKQEEKMRENMNRPNKGSKPRKRSRLGPGGEARSAADAASRELQKKRVSSRINYSALEGLFAIDQSLLLQDRRLLSSSHTGHGGNLALKKSELDDDTDGGGRGDGDPNVDDLDPSALGIDSGLSAEELAIANMKLAELEDDYIHDEGEVANDYDDDDAGNYDEMGEDGDYD